MHGSVAIQLGHLLRGPVGVPQGLDDPAYIALMKPNFSRSSAIWWAIGLIAVALVAVVKWGDGTRGRRSPYESRREGRSEVVDRAALANSAAALPVSELARLAVDEGNRLLAQGKVTNAIASYLEALTLTPDDADVHYNLGLANSRANRLAEAEQYYRSALGLDPDYPEVHNNLGNLLLRQKRFDEAEAEFEEALRLLSDYTSAHNNLGTLYQQQGRPDQALECFQEAVTLNPDYWEAWFNLGQSQFERGEISLAADAFREVLRIEPRFGPAKKALAEVQSRLGSRLPAGPE